MYMFVFENLQKNKNFIIQQTIFYINFVVGYDRLDSGLSVGEI